MSDRVLKIGRAVLGFANAANWVFALGLIVGLLLSFPLAGTLLHLLSAKYHRMDVVPVLWAMRSMALLAVPAAIMLHLIFTRLSAIVDSARAGDPFVAANARHLQAIGWALLGFQLLDLAFGAITGWLAMLHVDRLDWTPSFGGWISVLMVFVLARVFTVGTRMRDDLALTV